MTKAQPIYDSFNAGELSPKMVARTSFVRYRNGVALLENMIPMPQGGVTRRAGSRYVAPVKNESDHTHLMSFQFSTQQAYLIEKGDLYFRFYTKQGQVFAPAVDSGITNGTFDTNLSGWTDDSTGTGAVTWNASGYAQLVGNGASNVAIISQQVNTSSQNTLHVVRFRIVGINGTALNFRVGTSLGAADVVADIALAAGYHCYEFTPPTTPVYIQFRNAATTTVGLDDVVMLNNTAVEIATPYSISQIHEVKGPQSADVMYLFHTAHQPYKLLRRGAQSWSLEVVDFKDGPFLTTNTTAGLTIAPSATTGNGITLTASGHSPFASTDVGRLVRLQHTNQWGSARITAVTAGHQATANVVTAFNGTAQTATWALGAWSNSRGWPQVSTFYEQRLVMANTATSPQTMWLSQVDDFENMMPDTYDSDSSTNEVQDDDALTYTIASDRVEAIRWMFPLNDLVIGTTGGEWTMGSDGPNIKPTDTEVKQRTAHGSDTLPPVRNGHHILFLQRAKRKIRQFTFDSLLEGYKATDVTRLADHITYSQIHEMAFAQEPHALVLCARVDGVLATLTHAPEEEAIGWSRMIFGGSFAGGNPVVESVASVPGHADTSSADRDEVWVIVKRTINGATRRYVEFLEKDHEDGDTQENAFYVDSGLTYSGSAVTTITGLTHLVGETVAVWGDGAVQPNVTVAADGSVTLLSAVAVAQIGLPYKHKIQSLKLDDGQDAGTAISKTRRIHELGFVLYECAVFSYGRDSSSLLSKDFRQVSDQMDTAVALFTGESVLEFPGEFAKDPRWYVESSAPAPFTLLAVTPSLRTNAAK